jgi:folate-binding protein YgfZ
MATTALRVAPRPREFVGVKGPDAEDYLQRMLSNDMAALEPGESCSALLLTPKGRIIAPMCVLRRADDDYLLLTEPGLGDRVREELTRLRFAAKAGIEQEEHRSHVLLGATEGGIPNEDYGEPAVELLDDDPPAADAISADELEALRIAAGTPAWGKELDDSILPAEADLDETHISFTKGCFPGQEPIARLHYRGHPNRRLRVLEAERADRDAEIVWNGKVVGRVTSAVPGRALAYVRTEVPDDALLDIGGVEARLH